MKKNFYRNLACMLIFTNGLCIATSTEAQVTVGSKGVPNSGALLDMKQEDKTDGSANSKKGLGLPRVALTAVDKLDPCVVTTGVAATDAAAKKSHIGLTVYNTTDNTSTAATLSEGVYAWDGDMWTQYSGTTAGGAENGLSMDGRKVVLGGPLNRPTTITGDATNNLTLNTPTKVGSTLGVTGATTLGSTLGVTGVTSLRNTNVTGNVVVSANTKTATSTVTGNETVGGTLVVTGVTTTKATNVTGVMKYTNTTPTVGQYLSATNADGTVAWTTLPSTATNTEPWRKQGGTAEATAPADNAYMTGNVAIGSNTSGTNKLQVTGNTNIIGTATTTGSSVVTGNETVGGTLGVTGATTLSSILGVTGATTLTGNLTSNGTTALKNTNVTGNVAITGNETISGTLGVTGVTTLNDVTIGTTAANKTATINGKLYVSDTPILPSSTALVVDVNGRIGTAASIPSKSCFVQSPKDITLTDDQLATINNGENLLIPWLASDIVSNNIVTFNPSDNSFSLNEDAICEISAFFNYLPRSADALKANSVTLLNVLLQYKEPSGEWQDFSGGRSIYPGIAAIAGLTTSVPPAILSLTRGTSLRMVINNPITAFGTGTNFLAKHGGYTGAGAGNGKTIIGSITGLEFCKGLKITVL